MLKQIYLKIKLKQEEALARLQSDVGQESFAPSMRNSIDPLAAVRLDAKECAIFQESLLRDRVLSDVAESYKQELEEGRDDSADNHVV